MTAVPGNRHLSWPNLREYLDAGAPAVVRIAGTPDVDLIIDPGEQRIALRGPWPETGVVPDLVPYRHLDTRVGTGPAGDWVEFAVSGRGVLREAYPMLLAVADVVQLRGGDMGTAIERVLASYRELLSSLGRLTEHQELGLYGELVILGNLIDSVGERSAIGSWRGPAREEHDFGLGEFDVEVKTTLSEDRSHRISSLTQLEPSPERDLWLVSMQLTTSGVCGTTLPELIERTMNRLSDPASKAQFADRLAGAGWDPDHSHLYTRTFVQRSPALAFRVTHEFPAITASRLVAAGLPVERFSHVSYVLHTAGLHPDAPPAEIEGIGTS
ncbi:MAG: PD-(D/E)XK motif protein [Chloroflexi bacterium]|nr:PD-(D/E)XK motif protein [Chloroflexota bacterium]